MQNCDYDVIVIGGGPGGYPAAIRAAQEGLRVAVVEQSELGGVCLNWGCIPTKALLKSAQVIETISHAESFGIDVSEARPNLEKIVARSRKVVAEMKSGVEYLMRKNGIEVIKGRGRIAADNFVTVTPSDGDEIVVKAKHTILATGGRPMQLPVLPIDGERVISSTDAMALKTPPATMTIVGGGAIGVEFAYFYNQLGTDVTIVESMDRLVPREDHEISASLEKSFRAAGITVLTGTKVIGCSGNRDHARVEVQSGSDTKTLQCDIVLSAVGISANIEDIGLEEVGVAVSGGKVEVDSFYETTVPGVYAIGDIVSGPALAHVATAEANICVGKIVGLNPTPLNYQNIPSCTYCQPEIASVGLTEREALASGFEIRMGIFPHTALGKAKVMGSTGGFTKLIFDQKYGELLGAHMIGAGVTELIAEAVVAKSLETTWSEVVESVHPHPTLSEALQEAAAKAYGKAIHI